MLILRPTIDSVARHGNSHLTLYTLRRTNWVLVHTTSIPFPVIAHAVPIAWNILIQVSV
jgi:hypothetical protein